MTDNNDNEGIAVLPPSERVIELKKALDKTCKEIAKKFPDISAMEVLAVFSQMTGMLIAYQDQTSVTVEQIMNMVSMNIQEGNAAAVEQLMKEQGEA